MTAHTPTAEQAAIIDAYGTGGDLVVEAGAGTGKTSTLVQLAEAQPRRGLYLAYNRSIADDARGRFPRSTECRTAHSLAYAAVGRDYRHRLNGPRVTGAEAARALRINDPVKIGDRADRLAFTADAIGRDVASSNELTVPEASALIDRLIAYRAQLNPQTDEAGVPA